MHSSFTFGEHLSKDPIYIRKVSQMDSTCFKEQVNNRIGTFPDSLQTARELDSVAEMLPVMLNAAFEASCPLRRVENKRKPVSPFILGLIQRKRKLRRMKSSAAVNDDPLLVQSLQREMNLVGNQIKKEQKKEQRHRHKMSFARLARENNPKKFFQAVKTLHRRRGIIKD